MKAEDILLDCGSSRCDYEEALMQCKDPDTGTNPTNIVTWTPDSSTPGLVYYQVCVCACFYLCVCACVCVILLTPSLTHSHHSHTHSLCMQCATHKNLGWKIRVTDSVEAYEDENSWPKTCASPSPYTSLWLSLSLLSLTLLTVLTVL